ncbi:MAG: hypothetical protein ACRDKW_07085, partial [Actinomycetota bacterium]
MPRASVDMSSRNTTAHVQWAPMGMPRTRRNVKLDFVIGACAPEYGLAPATGGAARRRPGRR